MVHASSQLAPLGLPDLDRIREILERIQQILVLGGVALAAVGAAIFLVAWVLAHLRRPAARGERARPVMSRAALLLAWLPVGLTIVAALGVLLPPLAPMILEAFAAAVVAAALAWCVAVATLIAGGSARDLARARKALLLAGTPWYCLVAYLATML